MRNGRKRTRPPSGDSKGGRLNDNDLKCNDEQHNQYTPPLSLSFYVGVFLDKLSKGISRKATGKQNKKKKGKRNHTAAPIRSGENTTTP